MRKITVTNNVTLDGVMQAPRTPSRSSSASLGRICERIVGAAVPCLEEMLVVMLGSGEFLKALMRRGLVDQLVLLVHPLVLGTGRRLFADDGALAKFTLARSVPTTKGVIIATYELTPAD